MALSPGSGGGQTIPPTIIDNELTAPLELPAESGKPLTTQSGSTLDDGSGNLTTQGYLQAGLTGDGAIYSGEVLGSSFQGRHGGTAALPGGVLLTAAATMNSGTGAPAIAGAVGDYFFRTDATTTADERIYVCTVAGAAGSATWVGIV